MKRVLFILSLWLLTLCAWAQVTITNDTMVIFWSDSFARAQYGQRQNDYIGTHYINKYPQWRIDFRDHSRSGDSNLGMLTNRFPKYGVPEWGATRGKTNVVNFLYASSNGGLSSNTIYGYFNELIQAPGHTYSQAGLLTNDWTQSSALYQNVVIGDIAYHTATGDPTARDRSYGARSVALANNLLFVDSFVNLSNTVVTAFLNTPNDYWFNAPLFDHPANEIQLVWALTTLFYPTNGGGLGEDTNIYTAIIDFNGASVSATNHCTVTGLSKSGNSINFTFHADRFGPGFDVPDGTITNDCRGAFTLMPALGNACCEILRITNLPAGTYQIAVDGSNCVVTTAAQLAAGFNWFTNYTGAFWAQKKEGLGLLRDMLDVSRADASSDAHPADNRLIEKFESYANAVWPTNNSVDVYIAEADMATREAELQAEDILIHNNAQQIDHTVSVSRIETTIVTTLTAGTVSTQ